MLFGDLLQVVTLVGAVILGAIYMLGGLIVNLYLARHGITEYQILRVKYLVVGLVYMIQIAGIWVLAGIPAFFLAGTGLVGRLALAAVSLLASVVLFMVWVRPPEREDHVLRGWRFWVAAGLLGAIFPMSLLIRQIFAPVWDVSSILMILLGLTAGSLAFMGQLYHYSVFHYGKEREGDLDPIGLGMPLRVQLAGQEAGFETLEKMGVPMVEPGLTQVLKMLDESESHYILMLELEGETQTLKVSKEMVQAILYRQGKGTGTVAKTPKHRS